MKTATEEDDQEDEFAWVTTLTEQEWIISEDEDQKHEIPEVLAMEALELGATAEQDQGTHKWSMEVDHKVWCLSRSPMVDPRDTTQD